MFASRIGISLFVRDSAEKKDPHCILPLDINGLEEIKYSYKEFIFIGLDKSKLEILNY